jgi:cytochrome c peroxidase
MSKLSFRPFLQGITAGMSLIRLSIPATMNACKHHASAWWWLLVFVTGSLHAANTGFEAYFQHEPIAPLPLSVETSPVKASLGEILFHDTRLSRDNRIACASCHQLDAGGDDNVALGLSSSTDHHTVNTPTVFNAIYNFRQGWDGAQTSIEETIDQTMLSQHEFNQSWDLAISRLKKDASLVQSFNEAYSEGITRETVIDALREFQKTLVTPNSRFDQYLRDEADDILSEDELAGYQLFKEQGCVSCHQGINIGGNLFQKFGVFYDYLAERGNITKSDLGRYNVTNRYIDEFVFKVPSLRNVAVTAPYLHDGSAETLEDVIFIMGKTQLGKNLKDEEVKLIKQFLLTLTGEYNNRLLSEGS